MNDPLFNPLAEGYLLNVLVEQPGAISEAAALLRPDDFTSSDRRLIFKAMLQLSDAGKPVDLVHLEHQLRTDGQWAGVGELGLVQLMQGGAVWERAADYARLVRDASERRRAVKHMETAAARLHEFTEQTDECMAAAIEGLLAIQARGQSVEARPLKSILPETLNQMCIERERDGNLIGLSTGLDEVDRATGGLRRSELWVVGALPGRGKTAFGLQVATETAKAGHPTVVFSLEMTSDQLMRRFLAATTHMGAAGARNPATVQVERWNQVLENAARFRDLPLFVDDASTLTLQQLCARARLSRRKLGIELIVVDYLRLVEGPGRELRERVATVANGLRQFPKDEGVAVLALSQLRRPSSINDVPSMIDLKESGDVENHANTVLLLYQPLGEDRRPTGEDEIIIGKQRNGPLGSVPVTFDRRTLTFRPRDSGPGRPDKRT